MKILIADDHAVLRSGLRGILAEEFPGAEFAEAASTPEALQRIRECVWDVVVLDITMPGRSGLEVLKESHKLRPKMPVLILSMHPEDQFAVRALQAGASGYLTKETAPDELVTAIRQVLDGETYVSSTLASKLASRLGGPDEVTPHEALSDREFEVLRLIGSGKTVSEIADMLSLSVKTVSTYRTRILAKMDMRTNAELIRYALQSDLVR